MTNFIKSLFRPRSDRQLFIARQGKQIHDCKFMQMFLRRLEAQWTFVF